MLPTVLTNADIVLDDRVIRGSVVIKDGQIADVSDGISRAPGSVGLGGDLLIPGLIELHTDNIESISSRVPTSIGRMPQRSWRMTENLPVSAPPRSSTPCASASLRGGAE